MGKAEGRNVGCGCSGVMGKQKGLGSVLIFWTRPYAFDKELPLWPLIPPTLKGRTIIHIYPFPNSVPILSTPLLLQTRNNCDVTNLSPSSMHYQEGNVLHITRGRGEITIFTPPISLSGANTLQNKSQCLSPNPV